MSRIQTLLFVPANRERMIARALDLKPDAIIVDLEDSVPDAEKETARGAAREAIATLLEKGHHVWVRINATSTGLAKDDVRAVSVPGLSGILLPKADSPEVVRFADALLRDAERSSSAEPDHFRIIAAIESARGLMRAEAIGGASPRLWGLAFGGEDFAADMQIERTLAGQELSYARHAIAVVARATGLVPIDTVFPYLNDLEGLRQDAETAKRAGFQAKLLIHPQQIEPVAAILGPSEEKLEAARRIVAAYELASVEGTGAVQVDGQMVDAPIARRARELLDSVERV